MTLESLMHKVHAAIRRNDGDMFVCLEADFPLASTWIQVMDLPICTMNGMVLLRFSKPLFAKNAAGFRIALVTYHEGRYYGVTGTTYREKDLIWEDE